MIAGGDVRLDAVGALQLAQQLGRDLPGVDDIGADPELGAGDDVGGVERILLAFLAIERGVDIVDQPLVEGPGIHLAFPVVDNGISEAKTLALHVGHARLLPGVARRAERAVVRVGEEGVDGGLQLLRCGQRVLVHGECDIAVGVDYRRRLGRRRTRRRNGSARRQRRGDGNREKMTIGSHAECSLGMRRSEISGAVRARGGQRSRRSPPSAPASA